MLANGKKGVKSNVVSTLTKHNFHKKRENSRRSSFLRSAKFRLNIIIRVDTRALSHNLRITGPTFCPNTNDRWRTAAIMQHNLCWPYHTESPKLSLGRSLQNEYENQSSCKSPFFCIEKEQKGPDDENFFSYSF